MDDEEWSNQDVGALIYIHRRDWLSSSLLFLHLLHTKSCVVLPPPPNLLCCYQGFWSDSIQIKKRLSQRRIVSIVSSTVDFLYFRIVWFGLRMVRQVLRQVITSIPLLLYFHLGQLLSVVALVQT